MSLILVTPLSQVEPTIRRYQPSHLMTLLSPEHMIETPVGFPADRHLKLGLNDVVATDIAMDPPNETHVENLIRFARDWDEKAPMLIHCWAGVSRSMAAAYIVLCDWLGPLHEKEIARAIRLRAPHACPNPLMVKLADRMLGRNGRMLMGVELIGRGAIVAEGEVVEFPLSVDEL